MARGATPRLTREERAAGLARVWSEVTYNYPMWHRHADLNWDAAFRERLTGVLAARSDWEYYRLLQSLAALVKDSHVRVWMPERLRETRGAARRRPGAGPRLGRGREGPHRGLTRRAQYGSDARLPAPGLVGHLP